MILPQFTISEKSYREITGIAAVAVMSSYLFCLGLYALAVSLIHSLSVRRVIKQSTTELLSNIGKAEIEDKIRTKAIDISKIRTDTLLSKTGRGT